MSLHSHHSKAPLVGGAIPWPVAVTTPLASYLHPDSYLLLPTAVPDPDHGPDSPALGRSLQDVTSACVVPHAIAPPGTSSGHSDGPLHLPTGDEYPPVPSNLDPDKPLASVPPVEPPIPSEAPTPGPRTQDPILQLSTVVFRTGVDVSHLDHIVRFPNPPPSPIGWGGFGQVFVATYVRTGRDVEQVAVKFPALEEDESGTAAWLLRNEMIALWDVNKTALGGHPNVMDFLEIFADPGLRHCKSSGNLSYHATAVSNLQLASIVLFQVSSCHTGRWAPLPTAYRTV